MARPGRPKLTDKEKRVAKPLYMTPEKLELLESLNKGGFSKTVHYIIDEHFRDEKHRDPLVETVLRAIKRAEGHLELLGAIELSKAAVLEHMKRKMTGAQE